MKHFLHMHAFVIAAVALIVIAVLLVVQQTDTILF